MTVREGRGRESFSSTAEPGSPGGLPTSRPARPGAVRARILACHGAADPHVPAADVAAFAEEMNHAEVDWQLVMYGRALHGFTHRHAVPGAMPGVAYDRL